MLVLFTYYRGGNSHLSLAHSLRDGDFELNALDELCSWFLAFDSTIFFRWLPNHVNNLVMWFSVHFDIFVG